MNRLRSMNPEQFGALLRTLVQVVGAIVGMYGFMTDAQWTTVSGAIVTLVTTGWGIWARSDANLIKSAAEIPAVQRVVAPGAPAIVASDNHPKVTST